MSTAITATENLIQEMKVSFLSTWLNHVIILPCHCNCFGSPVRITADSYVVSPELINPAVFERTDHVRLVLRFRTPAPSED